MDDDNQRRFARLEASIAHLEHQVEQMNEVIVAREKSIDRLKKDLQRLALALESLESEQTKANNPRPPHYQ